MKHLDEDVVFAANISITASWTAFYHDEFEWAPTLLDGPHSLKHELTSFLNLKYFSSKLTFGSVWLLTAANWTGSALAEVDDIVALLDLSVMYTFNRWQVFAVLVSWFISRCLLMHMLTLFAKQLINTPIGSTSYPEKGNHRRRLNHSEHNGRHSTRLLQRHS